MFLKHGKNNEQVKVIKEWNAQRLNIKPLLGDMLAYLLDEQHKSKSKHYGNYYNHNYRGLLSKP